MDRPARVGTLILVSLAFVFGAAPAAADAPMKRFTIPDSDPSASKAAVTCRSVDGRIATTLYRLDAVGKDGVPNLSKEEREAATVVRNSTHFRDLRFAYVGPQKRFILFRSTGIVCRRELMAYEVLNGRCDEYWSPSDEADRIVLAAACNGAERPWQTPSSH
jgi:hypothetical protein